MTTFSNPKENVTVTYRDFQEVFHGVKDFVLFDANIQWDLGPTPVLSHVIATATEVANDPGPVPFIGTATVSVNNVAVRTGSATIRVNVEWGSDLRIFVQVMIFTMTNPTP